MNRLRVFIRPEGWYFTFVLVFVLGGAVLRQVNLLVALAGLMAAILLIHYQLLLHALSRLTVRRNVPPRICVGDPLTVTVSITSRHARGVIRALEFRESIVREAPRNNEGREEASVLFPTIEPRGTSEQTYECRVTRRGAYRFPRTELRSRYPFGLLEGYVRLALEDRFLVCPALGTMTSAWMELIYAEHDGQQRTRHRRGLLEADFYALRAWRNGDSQRWIHWRTSAKLGTLAVRQFEQRRNCDVALVVDLWRPRQATREQLEAVEQVISCAATAIADLARQGGAQLAFIMAGESLSCRHAAASQLFAHELWEQLATCEASDEPALKPAMERLTEHTMNDTRVIVLSTRPRPATVNFSRLACTTTEPLWIDASNGELPRYFQPRPEVTT